MMNSATTKRYGVDHLVELICSKHELSCETVTVFDDYTGFLLNLFQHLADAQSQLIGAGHFTSEIEIAADQARIERTEIIGSSPFTSDIERVREAINSRHDIIVLSNPNRISGMTHSLSEIRKLAAAVPEGAVIVDEQYFEHFGITAVELIGELPQVYVLRSLTASYGILSSDSGFLVADKTSTEQLQIGLISQPMSSMVRRNILTAQTDHDLLTFRVNDIHDESYRIASALNRIGVQSRLSQTDFLLIRVKDPISVGNALAAARIPIENLDGYPSMKNYIRYRVQSNLLNNRLIDTFRRMTPSIVKMKTLDLRAETMRLKRFAVENNRRLSPERMNQSVVEPEPVA
jgi:histidinol-phosphate aminotransferase